MKRPEHMTAVVSPVGDGVECLVDMSRVESAWPYDDYIIVKMRNGTNIHMTPESWDEAVESRERDAEYDVECRHGILVDDPCKDCAAWGGDNGTWRKKGND